MTIRSVWMLGALSTALVACSSAPNPNAVPKGQGWYCFRDNNLGAYSYCTRSDADCRDFRESLINDDAKKGLVANLGECGGQPQAACLTYDRVVGGDSGHSCSMNMHDCEDAIGFYRKRSSDFKNVSTCGTF